MLNNVKFVIKLILKIKIYEKFEISNSSYDGFRDGFLW